MFKFSSNSQNSSSIRSITGRLLLEIFIRVIIRVVLVTISRVIMRGFAGYYGIRLLQVVTGFISRFYTFINFIGM